MKIRWNWKYAFWGLLLVNIIGITIILILFLLPSNGNFDETNEDTLDSEVSLKLQTNKKDLNNLINYYIEKGNKNGRMQYEVDLDNTVDLYGILPVFDKAIEMKLSFLPEANENGDLILYQESISIGDLNLPVKYIMNFINRSYDFPEWVEIFPNEEIIYVHLTQLELKNNLKLKVDRFDLKNDQISFSLVFKE